MDGMAMADGLNNLHSQEPRPVLIEERSGNTPGIASSNPPSLSDAQLPKRRFQLSETLLSRISRSVDFLLACLVSTYFLDLSGRTILSSTVFEILPYFAIPFVTSWGLKTANSYEFGFRQSAMTHMIRTANGAGLPLALLGVITYLVYQDNGASWAIQAILATWLSIFVTRTYMLSLIRHFMRKGYLSENIVIVGATPNAQRLIERNQTTRDVNIVGIFDDRLARAPRDISGVPLLGQMDDLMNWERLPEIDRIVVTITSDARTRVKELIDRLRALPQRVILLLDLDGFDPETESLGEIARSPAAYVSGAPQDLKRAFTKRCSDLFFASALLIAFSPILLLVAVLIRLESPGPIIFRQRRHGFNNQIIRVWKFRSMRDDPSAAESMQQQTQDQDPRITRIGGFLRKTSIDELPQLFNVLKGEMSLVGPRPHAVGMTSEETAVHSIVGDYAHRHRVKPGITGWAQINGSRGPVHTKALVRDRVRLDMEYINRGSFWFDIYIMIMTAPCLLGDSGKQR